MDFPTSRIAFLGTGLMGYPMAGRLLLKDVRLIIEEATLLGLATPALEGVQAILETTIRNGRGDADYSALSAAVDPGIE